MTNTDSDRGDWVCSYGHAHQQFAACAEEARHGLSMPMLCCADKPCSHECNEDDPCSYCVGRGECYS